jgi:N4-acetylcytidine amidohydrolase
MEIKNFPFSKEFENSMICGTKTKTSRNKKYGNIGDTFTAFGKKFTIVNVEKEKLEKVAKEYHADEGFASPDGFIEKWKELHPIKKWDPDHIVFVHSFKKT